MENANYKTALNLLIQSLYAGEANNQVQNHQLILTLGHTPEILIQLGYEQLPLVVTGKVIDKALFDHGVTKPILERAYKIIESPKAIFKSDSTSAPNGAVLIAFELNKQKEPLIVAIHPNKQQGRSKVNFIASMYYKQGDAEKRWKDKGLLQWEAF